MMFREFLRKTTDRVYTGLRLHYAEKTNPLHGEYWMYLRDGQTGALLEERHGTNIIVNSASILIARLLKDPNEPGGGITYLAVGTGGSGWNLQNPPQPTVTQTALFAEIGRKAFTTEDVTFIDPITGDPTIVPTNVVDYTATFAETEAVGAWVEMGLFGGDATSLINTGIEVNYRTFPVINKGNSMTLTIIFRITS